MGAGLFPGGETRGRKQKPWGLAGQEEKTPGARKKNFSVPAGQADTPARRGGGDGWELWDTCPRRGARARGRLSGRGTSVGGRADSLLRGRTETGWAGDQQAGPRDARVHRGRGPTGSEFKAQRGGGAFRSRSPSFPGEQRCTTAGRVQTSGGAVTWGPRASFPRGGPAVPPGTGKYRHQGAPACDVGALPWSPGQAQFQGVREVATWKVAGLAPPLHLLRTRGDPGGDHFVAPQRPDRALRDFRPPGCVQREAVRRAIFWEDGMQAEAGHGRGRACDAVAGIVVAAPAIVVTSAGHFAQHP